MELSQVIRAEPNARQVGALSVHRSPNTRIISAFARIRCTIPATSVTRDRDLRAFSFLFFFLFFRISKQRELAAAETPRVSPPHLLLTFSEQFSEPRESIALHINYGRHRGV